MSPPLRRNRRYPSLAASGVSALLALGACSQADERRSACVAGLWQSTPDTAFAVNVRDDGSARITAFDGRAWTLEQNANRWSGSAGIGGSGVTDPATLDDTRCSQGRLNFTTREGSLALQKVEIEQRTIKFKSGSDILTGKLVRLKNVEPEKLVVLLHGSEKRSAVSSNPLQYLLPSKGIAAFVFDKRGTGQSAGDYTQNFERLAADGVNALAAARNAMGRPTLPAGYLGGSQGAWIGPLAAARAPVNARPDFLIAAYGLVQSPLAEDREEVFDDLRKRGFTGETTLAKAREITDATAIIMQSDFTRGFDRLNALKEKYGNEPWYGVIEGDFTGDFLWMPWWLLSVVGPLIDDDTSWDYEPLPVVRTLPVPMLWVLAGKDSEAPNATTFEILRRLQTDDKRPIDIASFADAEHGMVHFIEKDGERIPTRYAPGYFELLSTWILKGELVAPKGAQTFARHGG
jgi:uncharacterized protein